MRGYDRLTPPEREGMAQALLHKSVCGEASEDEEAECAVLLCMDKNSEAESRALLARRQELGAEFRAQREEST